MRSCCFYLSMLWVLLAPTAFGGFSSTTLNPGEPSRYELRERYKTAIGHIRAGRWSQYENLRDELIDYPLYPYLEYTARIYSIQQQSAETILPFVERYADTPIADRLLENWVFVLAKQRRWTEFLEYFDASVSGKRNACFHARALHEVGRQEEAMAAARDLWVVDFSQPDECDDVFRFFRAGGGLDRETAWRRFSLTLQAGEVSLAGYLTRFLDEADQDLASNFRQLPRNPGLLARTGRFAADTPNTREAIAYGLKRLARRDPDRAFTLLERYRQSHSFDVETLADLYSYVGIRVALDEDENGVLDNLPLDMHDVPELTEARIRLALRRQDWSDVLVLINLLPPDEQKTLRWRYWQARVLIASADPADRALARETYNEIARARNFYGFLAADALGIDYEFEDEPILISEAEVLQLESRDGIQRALELLAIGERNDARIEWYHATRNYSDRELQVAARVAQKWGWYRQAIKSMIDAEAWDDLEIRFPLAYQHAFIEHSRRWDIPLHWSYAIARQESAFMPDARSSAGARGIMQLMPATARLAADAHGVPYSGTDVLTDPVRNIEIGTAYLGQMLRRFNNNRILASAAYNAGPSRALRWQDPSLPLDVWIETIPFSETRGYVQNVLMFAAIYARQLEQQQPFIYAHEFNDFSNQRVTLFAEDEMTTTPVSDVGSE